MNFDKHNEAQAVAPRLDLYGRSSGGPSTRLLRTKLIPLCTHDAYRMQRRAGFVMPILSGSVQRSFSPGGEGKKKTNTAWANSAVALRAAWWMSCQNLMCFILLFSSPPPSIPAFLRFVVLPFSPRVVFGRFRRFRWKTVFRLGGNTVFWGRRGALTAPVRCDFRPCSSVSPRREQESRNARSFRSIRGRRSPLLFFQ